MRKEITKKEGPIHTPREIELEPEGKLWEDFEPETRKKIAEITTKLVPYGLVDVKTGITDEGIPSITVRKTSDNSLFYYTERPSEVEILKHFEIMPK